MDFPNRLNKFIKAKRLKKKDLPKRLGISRSILFAYLGGDNVPSISFIAALKREFPELDINWLITGIGVMESRSTGVHQVANADGTVQVGGEIKINGNAEKFVIGGNHRNKTTNEKAASYGNGLVKIDKVVQILEDYVAPKVIEEIKERLGK